jgi:hypothetical protein
VVEDIGFPLLPGSPTDSVATVQCSARGCRAAAVWQLRWNNPKIHTESARKTWLACPDHRDSLGDFLGARRFLREVEPFPSADGPIPDPGPLLSEPVTDAGTA